MSSGLRVSQAIYQAIYAVPRGELRRELLACLPRASRSAVQGRRTAGPDLRHHPRTAGGGGGTPGARALGGRSDQGGRQPLLGRHVGRAHQPQAGPVKLADAKAETARDGFAAGLLAVPAPLRLTLTYDQGTEMARHRELAALTGLRVYFADPHAPWQRGSNENTNGLLRQYLPKGTDLSVFSQAELDAIATRLNSRPRKTLGFATPDEVFAALVDKAANAVLPDPRSGRDDGGGAIDRDLRPPARRNRRVARALRRSYRAHHGTGRGRGTLAAGGRSAEGGLGQAGVAAGRGGAVVAAG